MVENVVDLPTQLQRTILTAHRNVLEQRHVVVEDRRHAQRVSRRVADVAQTRRPRKTIHVDDVRRSRRIGAADVSHRIANRVSTRVVLAAGDVGDAAVVSHSNVLRLAARIRRRAGKLPVIEDRFHETVIELPAQRRHVVDVVDRQDMRLVEIRWRIVEVFVRTRKRNFR